MDSVSLTLALSPHGHLVFAHEEGAPSLEAGLARRVRDAFDRGPGHGLLQLGADEAGTALPAVYSYWRELGARYVTPLSTQPDVEPPPQNLRVPAPPEQELSWMALAVPPMVGAEYLTAGGVDSVLPVVGDGV